MRVTVSASICSNCVLHHLISLIIYLLGSDKKLIREIRWCSARFKQNPADNAAHRTRTGAALETAVHENPRRSAASEKLKPPCLAPTFIPWSKPLTSHFFPILTFGLNNSWTSWPPRLHAFMHLVAAARLADLNICINKLVYGFKPNKVLTESTISTEAIASVQPWAYC